MPYRIDAIRTETALVLAFQGLLDEAALADLRSRMPALPGPVRLVLRAGTEVEPACLDALRTLPLAGLAAESPYLARWLSEES